MLPNPIKRQERFLCSEQPHWKACHSAEDVDETWFQIVSTKSHSLCYTSLSTLSDKERVNRRVKFKLCHLSNLCAPGRPLQKKWKSQIFLFLQSWRWPKLSLETVWQFEKHWFFKLLRFQVNSIQTEPAVVVKGHVTDLRIQQITLYLSHWNRLKVTTCTGKQ